VIVENDSEAVMKRLASDDFSPQTAVLIDRAEAVKLASNRRPLPGAEGAPGSAEIVSHRPNEIVVTVTTPFDAILVTAETYFPGWIAEVNGERKEIIRANGFQRAVKGRARESSSGVPLPAPVVSAGSQNHFGNTAVIAHRRLGRCEARDQSKVRIGRFSKLDSGALMYGTGASKHATHPTPPVPGQLWSGWKACRTWLSSPAKQ